MSKRSPSTPTPRAASTSGPSATSRPTTAQQRLAAQRSAAARERIAATRRRSRLIVVGSAVGVVVLVAAILVVVKVAGGSSGTKSGTRTTRAARAVTAAVSSVPPAVLDAVGRGDIATPPSALSGPPLTSGGHPEVLYVGGEYCPFCAAERWALAVALSRFGTLGGLGETSSSPSDVYPDTATLSFHGATYRSDHLTFDAKEIYTNQAAPGGGYTPLDPLTPAEQALFTNVGQGSFPFVDLGGRYVISGSSYDPAVLKGMTQAQIATALSDASSPVARAVDGTANVITAALCTLTGDQPAAVCSSSGVTAAAAALPAAS